jgi:hypothetical protein
MAERPLARPAPERNLETGEGSTMPSPPHDHRLGRLPPSDSVFDGAPGLGHLAVPGWAPGVTRKGATR